MLQEEQFKNTDMKQFITLLLAFLLFTAAKCQEPDTHTYSDSLFQATVDSLTTRIIFLESIIEINEVSVIADTFNFEVVDDRIKVEVNKINHDVWINIIDGSKRINADYVDNKSSVLIMDSTYTVGSLYINN